ncbi:SCO family protein [Variovorax sp. J22R133]|uniref:SCO family protein n=1 Tax=Variovorax brevis TaxID=3053503 RepID=UPI0025772FF0|nr:SCO family protein [Variovorax sp. J22R133]MDM0115128.1 SCO family protein [Variovorax sp. J22R133]
MDGEQRREGERDSPGQPMTRSGHLQAPGRRAFLAALPCVAMVAIGAPKLATAHPGHSPPAPGSTPSRQTMVQPTRPLARIALRMARGGSSDLRSLLDGRVTAVQLMFTGCGTTCLTQGALFAALQDRLLSGKPRDHRLLSISIDALGDDPKVLSDWLGKFSAQGALWTAGVPSVRETEKLLAEFSIESRSVNAAEHLNRVFVVDPRGFLRVVTALDPSADQVMQAMDLARA